MPMKKFVYLALVEFGLLVALLIGVVAVVFLDGTVYRHAGHGMQVTEITQTALVFLASMMFFVGSRRLADRRSYLFAASMLFLAMFIRELDGPLDVIWKGFWKGPVALAFVMTIWVAYRARGTFLVPLSEHFRTRSFTFLYIGFLLIVVFSRLFGTGHLWQSIMQESYNAYIKGAIQEATELLGYALLFYGACLSYFADFGASDKKVAA